MFTVAWTADETLLQDIVDAGLHGHRVRAELSFPGRTAATVYGAWAHSGGSVRRTDDGDGGDTYILFHDGADEGAVVPAIPAQPHVPGVPGVQAYVDVYQPGSTSLGFRVALDPLGSFVADHVGAGGNSFELGAEQGGGTNIVSVLFGTNQIILTYTPTATIQDIINSASLTGFVNITLLAGTDASTVMGQSQTGAQLFGSQTFDDSGVYPVADFHDGVDAVAEVPEMQDIPGEPRDPLAAQIGVAASIRRHRPWKLSPPTPSATSNWFSNAPPTPSPARHSHSARSTPPTAATAPPPSPTTCSPTT